MASDDMNLVRCVSCGWNFETRSYGRIDCPNCQAQIWLDPPEGIHLDQPTDEDLSPEQTTPDQQEPSTESNRDDFSTFDTTTTIKHKAEPEPIQHPSESLHENDPTLPAWESDQGHWLGRFIDTIRQVMINPIRFFGGLQAHGYRRPLYFAWIIATIAVVSFSLYGMLQLDRAENNLTQTTLQEPNQKDVQDPKQVIETFRSILMLSFYTAPFIGLLNLIISSLLYHLGVLLLATQHRNFTATFRATAYSSAPLLLGTIPFVGYLLGGLWSLALQVIAMAQIHRMGLARAVVVVLWPITMALLLLNTLY